MNAPKRIAVVHNAVPENAGPEHQDTMQQVHYLAGLLQKMGCEAVACAVGRDFEADLCHVPERTGAELALNLVEALAGSGRGLWQAPVLLQEAGLPCTGAGGLALLLSSNKLLAGQVLDRAGLPRPGTLETALRSTGLRSCSRLPGAWIVKSVWEHASLGLDACSVLHEPRVQDIIELMAARRAVFGGQWYAEAYIPGREFSLSLLAFDGGVQTLPPAEMLFLDWEPGRPQILDFAAKWRENDPVFEKTNRSFRFSEKDSRLLEELPRLALACWDAFGLEGYARVDFRVDAQGRPWIIDVNANPCLAPDAGFAAALKQAQIPKTMGLRRILDAGLRRGACGHLRKEVQS